MATGAEVLSMLIPQGGWVISGDDYSGIQFIEANPITEAEFTTGFAQYDQWKNERDQAKATEHAAILERLGITEDEAKLIIA